MPAIDIIFRDWSSRFLTVYGNLLSREQRNALADIIACRTPEMKYGILYVCPDCGGRHFSWQSCGNRNCPKCGNEKITCWLAARQQEILPVDYFMVTFALPAELRGICRQEPVKAYNAFFKAAAESLKELSMDKRFIGGKTGIMGTLQTWRRDGEFHPHLHFLVPGGGLSPDGKYWLYPKNHDFLVAEKPLAKLFRNKFRIELKKLELEEQISQETWRKDWVADVENVGNGMSSFKYLAPYMQRGFISNNRIEAYDGESVTFHYKDSKTGEIKRRTMQAMQFMELFLQHVLPSGFQKTRYYGILGSANKKTIAELRLLILTSRNQPPPKNTETFVIQPRRCAKCGIAMKILNHHTRPPPEMGLT